MMVGDAASPGGLLRTIAGKLEAAGIPFMVVGSFASTVHGEPRTTMDVDIVIDPTAATLAQLLASLDPEEFYVDADTARDALRRRSMFNVIEMATAWKVDLMIRKDRPFSVEELSRRVTSRVIDVAVPTATAEDTIIAKLEWASASSSERQLLDVAGILRVQAGSVDMEYIERWVAALELAGGWARARALAGG